MDVRNELKKKRQADIEAMNQKKSIEDAMTRTDYNFINGVYTLGDSMLLDIQEPQMLLDPWLTQESIAMIAGHRGIGKTWFAMSIGKAVSEGTSFGPWKASEPAKCLYFDGELPMYTTCERIRQLNAHKLEFYNNAYSTGLGIKPANLQDPVWLHCWSNYPHSNGIGGAVN